MDNIKLHTIIAECLAHAGWTPVEGAAIAQKFYQTAVGPKVAHANVSKGDGYNLTLFGDYQSEGRNALEAHSVLIPMAAEADTVRRLAFQFADRADAAVAQTYASHLYQSASVPS